MFISKTDNGETTMMWFSKEGTKNGRPYYGARMFDVGDRLPSNMVNLDEWNHFHAPEDRADDATGTGPTATTPSRPTQ